MYEILQRTHAKKYFDNTLATEAEEKIWIPRKTPFKTGTADETLDFPEMSSQAVSYLAGILDKVGKLTLKNVKEEPNVLEFKVNLDIFLEHHIEAL